MYSKQLLLSILFLGGIFKFQNKVRLVSQNLTWTLYIIVCSKWEGNLNGQEFIMEDQSSFLKLIFWL